MREGRIKVKVISMKINSALILAAGEGSRLATQKLPFPKPLQLCHDISLAERSLTALHQHGINKFYVMLGYKKDEVKAHFQEIASKIKLHVNFIGVVDWQKGNGVSALAAQTQLKNSSFLLTMVDHVFEREFIAQFLSSINESEDEICLAVDFKPSEELDLVDATKVEVKNQHITKIGKDMRDWQEEIRVCFIARLFCLKDSKLHRKISFTPCHMGYKIWQPIKKFGPSMFLLINGLILIPLKTCKLPKKIFNLM